MEYGKDFDQLTQLVVLLVESQARVPIDDSNEWAYYAQPLAKKLFMHLASMRALWEGLGYEVDGIPPFVFVDHSTINLIARAVLETFLTFHHLFVEDVSIEERKLRLSAWHLSGLIERQKFHAFSEEAKKKLAEEADQVRSVSNEITQMEQFQSLKETKKKKILEGEWRQGIAWATLAARANLNENYFRSVYRHLCG